MLVVLIKYYYLNNFKKNIIKKLILNYYIMKDKDSEKDKLNNISNNYDLNNRININIEVTDMKSEEMLSKSQNGENDWNIIDESESNNTEDIHVDEPASSSFSESLFSLGNLSQNVIVSTLNNKLSEISTKMDSILTKLENLEKKVDNLEENQNKFNNVTNSIDINNLTKFNNFNSNFDAEFETNLIYNNEDIKNILNLDSYNDPNELNVNNSNNLNQNTNNLSNSSTIYTNRLNLDYKQNDFLSKPFFMPNSNSNKLNPGLSFLSNNQLKKK